MSASDGLCDAFLDSPGGRTFRCTEPYGPHMLHQGIAGTERKSWVDGARGAMGQRYAPGVLASAVAPLVTEPAFRVADPLPITGVGPPRLPYPLNNLAVPNNAKPAENSDVSLVGAKPAVVQPPYVILPKHDRN